MTYALTGRELAWVVPVDGTRPGPLLYQTSTGDIASLATTRLRVTLRATQLLHLFSSPVLIVPSPGPGRFTLLSSAVIALTAGTTPYISADDSEGLCYAPLPAPVGSVPQSPFTYSDSSVTLVSGFLYTGV